jgi:hypothetical protein
MFYQWSHSYVPSQELQLGAAGPARERDDVADVLDAGGEEHHALEAEAEAEVRDNTEAAQVQEPFGILDK